MDGLLKYLAEFGAPRSEETISKLATGNPLMLAKAARNRAEVRRAQISDLMNYPQDWSQFGQNLAQAYPTSSPEAVRQTAYQAAMNVGPLATVYHGSPYKFDAFDSSKIGTGEGAQAYGHGMYFAENPSVANAYRESLTAANGSGYPKLATSFKSGGKEIFSGQPEKWNAADIASMMKQYGVDPKTAEGRDWLRREIGARGLDNSVRNDVINFLRQGVEKETTRGALYKVDLPDDQIAKMLDWDKPLSQQPEVTKALSRLGIPVNPEMTGGQLMRSPLVKGLSDSNGVVQRIESLLKQKGIPGIRYLDGGSRAGGQGTSNFVVFPGNEGILKILGRE